MKKVITVNRRAHHDYTIQDTFEAGLVLTGTEIKSVRLGLVNLRDAYASPLGNEVWLYNAHIAKYPPGGIYNHDPDRPRKLLLHRSEIRELIGKVSQKGYTIIPLRLYIDDHVAKVEVGLGRGKKQYEKKQALIEKEIDLEARQAMKRLVKPR